MKVFLFAQTLQPDGRKIAKANQLARFKFFQWKFEKCFGRVKRVGATRACIGFPISETEMTFEHEQAFAHERDRVIAHEKSVDEIVLAANRLHLSHHPRSVEPLIRCAVKNEALERLKIDRVRRHAGVNTARTLRRFAHATSVTNRAVQENAINSLRVAT